MAGLVRKKNVLATMMQSFAMMALVTIMWGIFEYSLAFGSGNSFIGGFEHLFLRGVGGDPNPDYAATIPHQTFMIYQLMFAIITPASNHRRLRRTNEIQGHVAVHGPLVGRRVQPDGAHGVGQGRIAERGAGWPASPPWILRAGPSCTSPRVFPRWFARSILAKRLGYPTRVRAAA